MELIKPFCGSEIKAALFDFDGTISLIRAGWQDIMIPYFCEVVEAVSPVEDKSSILEEVTEFVTVLTGKQTIYQCMALNDAVIKRGGKAVEPGEYKKEYLRRLSQKTADTLKGLEDGTVKPDDAAVKGSIEFVKILAQKGIRCYLASGTDEPDVIREAGLLGLGNSFEGGIHGARDALLDCSKEAVIRHLLEDEKISPEELVAFGDGFVEIELVANLGGYAVGLATDELKRCGIDKKKKDRLVTAGAGVIFADFSEPQKILSVLNL